MADIKDKSAAPTTHATFPPDALYKGSDVSAILDYAIKETQKSNLKMGFLVSAKMLEGVAGDLNKTLPANFPIIKNCGRAEIEEILKTMLLKCAELLKDPKNYEF